MGRGGKRKGGGEGLSCPEPHQFTFLATPLFITVPAYSKDCVNMFAHTKTHRINNRNVAPSCGEQKPTVSIKAIAVAENQP